ncbi:MAG: SMC family ATPase [Mycobacteriaceae bacterium]
MRLHSLQVTAFGPFAGTESVDFDALGADGLFLLHGPTGAGKTTVLDAVAFALFGALPGARSDPDGRRLLSDHAAPGTGPRVVLELTVGGSRLRLERSPEHQRPRLRGSGTTKAQASASLTWLDEPQAAPCTRIDEVAREVERLLGMSADQFFQVVLLPQGAFATFLRANTAERATLLEKLFDTARFADAEQWLVERRRRSASAVEEATHELQVALARLATAAGVEPAPDDTEEWVRSLRVAAAAADASARLELTRARVGEKQRRQAVEDTRARAALVLRRDEATSRLAEIASGASALAQDRAALDAGARAQHVAVAEREAASARLRAQRSEHEVTALTELLAADPDGAAALARTASRAEAALFDVARDEPAALFALPDLSSECDRWRREVGRLGELVTVSEEAAKNQARVCELAERVDILDRGLADVSEQRRALPLEQEVAEADLRAARRAADSLVGLVDAAAQAGGRVTAAAEVPEREAAHTCSVRAHAAAVSVQLDTRQHCLDLREQRLQGMAAELAGQLTEGAACTVCGAVEHPALAQQSAFAVSGDDEATARAAEQAAVARVAAAATTVAAAAAAVELARVRSAGLTPTAAREAHERARAAQVRAQSLADTLGAAEERCATVTAVLGGLAQQELVLGQNRASAQAQRATLTEALAHAQQRTDAARGADDTVLDRLQRLDALVATGAKLVAAATAARGERQDVAERERCAVALATEQGFANVAAALAAVLPEEQRAARAARVEQVDRDEAHARAVLDEREVHALGALDARAVRDALAAAVHAQEFAGQQLGQAHAAAATAAARHEQVSVLGGAVAEQLLRLRPALELAARLTALADVVAGRGQNARKVSLHSYVLAARLEEVAAAASLRLRRMSAGRYEFVHTDAAGPRGTRGGLGLDVLDDHTGAQRSTKTLSGGESFMASLSLALGLADVVAEEAGGVQLDTLFIDEGFGSLDSTSLEEVMAVLDELRAGGRVVGIVSHVDELRHRIPSQLQVVATRTGSCLTRG